MSQSFSYRWTGGRALCPRPLAVNLCSLTLSVAAVIATVALPAAGALFPTPASATEPTVLQTMAAPGQTATDGSSRLQLARTTEAAVAPTLPARKPAVLSHPSPLIAIVSIADQNIEVFDANGSTATSRISSGRAGNETPTGVFTILQRNRHHRSNIYSNAPMPFMQRLTWSGIALHEGNVPNYPASHGCIRLPGGFAERMWGIGQIGMRVIVSPQRVRPVSFAHKNLPRPWLTPMSSIGKPLKVASAAGDMPAQPDTRLSAPYAMSVERWRRAVANRNATRDAIKPANELANQHSAAARAASEALKASQRILADAEEYLAQQQFAMATIQLERLEVIARERIETAKAGLIAAYDAHQALILREKEATRLAFESAVAAREAREAAEAAALEYRFARRARKPVSIFVSRKTNKVYVRQGSFALAPEQDIAIAEPDRPIGTHVFTAMEASGDGASLRWTAVTVPTSGGLSGVERQKGKSADSASSAAEALERFQLPETIESLIGDRLWPGASLIISDYGLGETGPGTDFVIITR